jgi:hypothetical protein
MIVYKLVTREDHGRLVSLMEKGDKQVEYKVGKAAYPATGGVLYAFDSPEGARPWMSGSNIELWIAEATQVTPTPYASIVGCKSLKLVEKIAAKSS